MKNLPICQVLNCFKYPKDDFVKYICYGLDAHKRIGFDCVNLSLEENKLNAKTQAKEIETIVRYANDLGMPFRLSHLPFAAAEEDMRNAIDVTKMLGVDYTVVHPIAPVTPTAEYDEKAAYEQNKPYLSAIIEYANKVGVTVVIENMRLGYRDGSVKRYCADLDSLIRQADELGIGICWDTGHGHAAGHIQSEALMAMGDRVKMLHINDNYGMGDYHLAPFLGNIDWQDTMNGLSAIGFDGIFSYEVSSKNIPDEACFAHGRYMIDAAKTLLSMMD